MIQLIVILYLAFCTINTFSQGKNFKIIPEPDELNASEQFYLVPDKFVVVSSVEFNLNAVLLGDWRNPNQIAGIDFHFSLGDKGKVKNSIIIRKDETIQEEESYKLSIGEKGILIQAVNEKGVYYAFKTLQQILLFPSNSSGIKTNIQFIEIYDKSRYAYRCTALPESSFARQGVLQLA